MIIDGVFKSNPEQIEEYQNILKVLLTKDKNAKPSTTYARSPTWNS